MTQVVLKITYEGDTRRFTCDSPTYPKLVSIISTLFPEVGDSFTLKYADDEGDHITITSEKELAEGLSISEKTPPLLRLFVSEAVDLSSSILLKTVIASECKGTIRAHPADTFVPDSRLFPESKFTRKVVVKNTGNIAFSPGTVVTLNSDSDFSGDTEWPVKALAPGEEQVLNLHLIAPNSGDVSALLRLSSAGTTFGRYEKMTFSIIEDKIMEEKKLALVTARKEEEERDQKLKLLEEKRIAAAKEERLKRDEEKKAIERRAQEERKRIEEEKRKRIEEEERRRREEEERKAREEMKRVLTTKILAIKEKIESSSAEAGDLEVTLESTTSSLEEATATNKIVSTNLEKTIEDIEILQKKLAEANLTKEKLMKEQEAGLANAKTLKEKISKFKLLIQEATDEVSAAKEQLTSLSAQLAAIDDSAVEKLEKQKAEETLKATIDEEERRAEEQRSLHLKQEEEKILKALAAEEQSLVTSAAESTKPSPTDTPMEVALRQLSEMGFHSRELNKTLLERHDMDIIAVINDITEV